MEIRLRQRLVYARLIGATRTAALEHQRDTLEGRTVSHAARPIAYDVMHGAMPSLGCHLARILAHGIEPQFPNGTTSSVRVHHEHREELGQLRLAGVGADVAAVAGRLCA